MSSTWQQIVAAVVAAVVPIVVKLLNDFADRLQNPPTGGNHSVASAGSVSADPPAVSSPPAGGPSTA